MSFTYEDISSVMETFSNVFPGIKADSDILSIGVKIEESTLFLIMVVKEAFHSEFNRRHEIPKHFPVDTSQGQVKVRIRQETKPLVQAVKPLRSKTPYRPPVSS